jgi:cytoskeleton protein RodZ
MTNEHTPMTVGARLRERRRELGLDLEALAATTRIRRTYLEALESDRFDLLPGEAYVSGFLRVYAGALGLDGAALDRERRPSAQSVVASAPPQPQLGRSVPAAPPVRRRAAGAARRRPLLPAAAILLAAGLLAPLVFYFAARDESKPVPVATPPAPPAVAPVPAPSEPRAVTAHEPEPVPPPDPAPAAAAAPGIPPAGAVLRIEAAAAVRLEMSIDGRPFRAYDLRADSALRWPVRQSARLRVDDPAAVRLWLDERPLDLAGSKEFFIPPATPERGG